MAEASFDFQMANFQMVRSSDSPYLAAVLVRALEGIQSPVGEKTEISLL
jgi:hypothetical protein